jgi:hypothetical protein
LSDIIIRISTRSYNLLKNSAKGGNFKKESKQKDGYYYISIDKEVYTALSKIDDDIDKAIFYAVLNDKVKI